MAKAGMTNGVKLDLDLDGLTLKSTFYQAQNDGTCLISMPLKDGASYTPASGTHITLSYLLGGLRLTAEGEVLGAVQEGVRSYLQLRTSSVASSERRVATRLPVMLAISLSLPREKEGEAFPSQTLDLSVGGAAVESNAPYGVGETVAVQFNRAGLERHAILAEVCWVRRAEELSDYRTILGIKFRYAGKSDSTLVEKLIANLQG